MLTTESKVSEATQRCIDACTRCHAMCTTMVPHCLSLGGVHAAAAHIVALLDCAEICSLSADFMSRESMNAGLVGRVCSDVCARCAEACETLADDPMMQECGECCRQCAQACGAMSTPGDELPRSG